MGSPFDPGRTGERDLSRARRSLAVCLVGLLIGVAVAPHRHKNDLADLLTDGRSDSGVFLDVSEAGPRGSPPIAESVRWIDDAPCPACFASDFVTTAAAAPYRGETLCPLEHIAARRHAEAPAERIALRASRSPPSL